MARLGRYFVKDQPLHVIHRGAGGKKVFHNAALYRLYRDWLMDAAQTYGVEVHAYVLMPNHLHLLLTPATAESLPRMMQSLGRRHVRFVNATKKRTGTLWDGRYRATPIDSDEYFLMCSLYIEQNPIRAGLAAHPRDYPWSSYGANAHGKPAPIVAGHAQYSALGRNAEARQKAYRELFRTKLDPGFIQALRTATNGGWALGDERFQRRIAKSAKRRASPLPQGRPANKKKGKIR